MNKDEQHFKAVKNLGIVNLYRHDNLSLKIVSLVRDEDMHPLRAPWWKGKDVYLLGADINGNFFLRHCDGSVRYWNHQTQSDQTIAPSVRAFLSRIIIEENE